MFPISEGRTKQQIENSLANSLRNKLFNDGYQLKLLVCHHLSKDSSIGDLSIMVGRVEMYIAIRKSLTPVIASDMLTREFEGIRTKLKDRISDLESDING